MIPPSKYAITFVMSETTTITTTVVADHPMRALFMADEQVQRDLSLEWSVYGYANTVSIEDADESYWDEVKYDANA